MGEAKLTILLVGLLLVSSVQCGKRFSMNKPHMLFQVSSRQPIAINSGWGYWVEDTSGFTTPRLHYENTQESIYTQMTEHNGETHFRQSINDTLYQLNCDVKYQSPTEKNDWEALISMNPQSIPNTNETSQFKYWPFAYFSIENNDFDSVDLVGYTSPKKLTIERSKNYVKVIVWHKDLMKEVFFVKALSAKHKFEVIGLELNVSESWNSRSIIKQFQALKEAQYFPERQKELSEKAQRWTDYQLKQLKDDEWEDKQFVFVVINTKFTGEDSETFHIKLVENRNDPYQQFDHARYDETSNELAKLYEGEPKQQLLKHVLFNLLGGIARYYGPLYAQNSLLKQQQTWTYSTTPSRLIFPRCFLWDDGFHLTILADKHPDKSLEFLSQWIAKIDLFGWIAREQIRGYQVSAMMPDLTFVYQDSLEGNPPTLMLPIRYMIEKYPGNQQLRALLERNMWKLEKWFRYFKTTQSHFDLTDTEQIDKKVKFRWRCKDSCQNGNFMGSGLDDYPRQDNRQLSKQHVDLISWLYFFAESLEKISGYLGQQKGQKYYRQLKNFYNETLHEHYLDHTDNLFKDISVSKDHNINEFVTHVGYINIFPFMMGMVAENTQHFNKIVEVLRDTKYLWSGDGIRSLSISDPMYGTGDNYWRGAVWMPINYLILRACKLYYPTTTKVLHDKLRQNLIDTVERNYLNSGYLYENYHQGQGNRGFPFYGWTSLINPIILDLY